MRSIWFALVFAALFATIFGLPTGNLEVSFIAAFVVGLLVYGFLRFVSMPFR